MEALVYGNVALDILCYPVNGVPRKESITFDDVNVSAGGCGSNTAIGLAALGIQTGIMAHCGKDESADLLFRYWERAGIDHRYISRTPDASTGVSIGLIDSDFQPRFIQTPGANHGLTAEIINPSSIASTGVRFFHIAGFFVLPGLGKQMAGKLAELQRLGVATSLDVVFNVSMDDPKMRDVLWASLPQLDYFIANAYEAFRLTGETDCEMAAANLRSRGVHNVIIKLGADGCYALSNTYSGIIPAPSVNVVDTTGAGDAFSAGLIAALARGKNIQGACKAGNQAGASVCTRLGAIAAWVEGMKHLLP